MPANYPCTSEDGNQAIVIISNIMPGVEVPTQALCAECVPAFLVAMLAQFTGVDVTEYIYQQAEAAQLAETLAAEDQAAEEVAAAGPPVPLPTPGRTPRRSRAAGTADAPAEAPEEAPTDLPDIAA